MKCSVSRKFIAYNYDCISVSYGALQYLLYYRSPRYYHSGVYGWNFDAYVVDNICITTGYRSTIHNYKVNKYDDIQELVKVYDNKAREIIYSDGNADNKQIEIENLLEEFIQKVKNL